jgi:hypothetical protein
LLQPTLRIIFQCKTRRHRASEATTMDKLKYSLFDIFAYFVPGFILLSTLVLANSPINMVDHPFLAVESYAAHFNAYLLLFIVILSYCLGFALQLFSDWLLQLLLKIKPFRAAVPKLYPNVGDSVKYSVVRDGSAENFRYIETWNVVSMFSASMAFVILFLSIYLASTNAHFQWLQHAGPGILLAAVFFVQARKFYNWSIIDLDNTYSKLLANTGLSSPPDCLPPPPASPPLAR